MEERVIRYSDIVASIEPAVSIVESEHATVAAEDWSKVRSPSRARRRLKAGIGNRNIRHYRKPTAYKMGNTIIIHPTLAKAIREQFVETMDRALMGSMLYGPASPPFKFDVYRPIRVEPQRDRSLFRYDLRVLRTQFPYGSDVT